MVNTPLVVNSRLNWPLISDISLPTPLCLIVSDYLVVTLGKIIKAHWSNQRSGSSTSLTPLSTLVDSSVKTKHRSSKGPSQAPPHSQSIPRVFNPSSSSPSTIAPQQPSFGKSIRPSDSGENADVAVAFCKFTLDISGPALRTRSQTRLPLRYQRLRLHRRRKEGHEDYFTVALARDIAEELSDVIPFSYTVIQPRWTNLVIVTKPTKNQIKTAHKIIEARRRTFRTRYDNS